MTLLQMVNKILKRLREDTVLSTDSTDYSMLIGEIIADQYRELQEVYAWESTKHTIIFDTVASQTRYCLSRNITSGGDARDANSRLACIGSIVDKKGAFVYDSDTDYDGSCMVLISDTERAKLAARDRDQTQDEPWYYSVTNDGVDWYLDFAWAPTQVKRCDINLITVYSDLETDGTDDNTVLYVPARPLYLGALAMALNERGEEIGEPGNLAGERYKMALAAAIEADAAANIATNHYDWYRD